MKGPSKITQFQSMPDGSIVALDSNGNLWQGKIDIGYWYGTAASQQYPYGISAWTVPSGQQHAISPGYQAGTGKIVWTKITE